MSKWFILTISTQKVEEVKELPDHIFLNSAEFMIWQRPFDSWFFPHELEERLISLEGQKIKITQEKRVWFFQKTVDTFGPFTENELLSRLKQEKELYKIWVFSKDNENSESIFKFENLLKDLGVQVRKNPRIAFESKVIVHEEGRSWPTKSMTLSAYGIGLKPPDNFTVSSPLKLKIYIKNQEIKVSGDIIYQTSQMLGIKFHEMDLMTNSLIITYLREVLGDGYTQNFKKSA